MSKKGNHHSPAPRLRRTSGVERERRDTPTKWERIRSGGKRTQHDGRTRAADDRDPSRKRDDYLLPAEHFSADEVERRIEGYLRFTNDDIRVKGGKARTS